MKRLFSKKKDVKVEYVKVESTEKWEQQYKRL